MKISISTKVEKHLQALNYHTLSLSFLISPTLFCAMSTTENKEPE